MTKQEFCKLDEIIRRMCNLKKWEKGPVPEMAEYVMRFERKEVRLLQRLLYNAESKKEYFFAGHTIETTSKIDFRWLIGNMADNTERIFLVMPDYSTLEDIIRIWNTIIGIGYKKFKLLKLEDIKE